MGSILFFVGLLALIGLAIWFAYYFKKKRREGLAAAATQLGLEFSTGDRFDLLSLPFALFKRGDGRGIENVMWGTWEGMDLKGFDYWYYEESTSSKGGRQRSYYRFSCAVTEVSAACSHLVIKHENLFTRLADHVGLSDIEFESEEFNRAFNVTGADRKFATDLVDPRMMQWLMESGRGWSFELEGPAVMCYSNRLKPTSVVSLLGTLREFQDHIPRVVWSMYGSGAPR